MLESLVDILGFLGGQKEYSYIDRLGNSLDEISIMEAVMDALRVYHTLCRNGGKCVKIDESVGIRCPEVDLNNLESSVDFLRRILASKSRIEVIKLSREIAMRAYARISYMLSEENRCTPQG
jgi:CRISPR-associated protein Csa5